MHYSINKRNVVTSESEELLCWIIPLMAILFSRVSWLWSSLVWKLWLGYVQIRAHFLYFTEEFLQVILYKSTGCLRKRPSLTEQSHLRLPVVISHGQLQTDESTSITPGCNKVIRCRARFSCSLIKADNTLFKFVSEPRYLYLCKKLL